MDVLCRKTCWSVKLLFYTETLLLFQIYRPKLSNRATNNSYPVTGYDIVFLTHSNNTFLLIAFLSNHKYTDIVEYCHLQNTFQVLTIWEKKIY